jgi:hypothetical protein
MGTKRCAICTPEVRNMENYNYGPHVKIVISTECIHCNTRAVHEAYLSDLLLHMEVVRLDVPPNESSDPNLGEG